MSHIKSVPGSAHVPSPVVYCTPALYCTPHAKCAQACARTWLKVQGSRFPSAQASKRRGASAAQSRERNKNVMENIKTMHIKTCIHLWINRINSAAQSFHGVGLPLTSRAWAWDCHESHPLCLANLVRSSSHLNHRVRRGRRIRKLTGNSSSVAHHSESRQVVVRFAKRSGCIRMMWPAHRN